MQVNMKTNSDFIDSRAQEFMNILRTDNNDELLNLYYNYKGFHTTGTADFVQTVVVEFMEKFCTKLQNKKRKQPIMKSEQPNKKQSTIFNHFKRLLPGKSNKFGDDWNVDFDSNHHPSIICDMEYTCNNGQSKIPTIFQSQLYFRKRKYYLQLLSDPFFLTDTVINLLYCFVYILHQRTRTQFSNIPWNFTFYNLNSKMIYVLFEYDPSTKQHKLDTKQIKIDSKFQTVINDMHSNNKYMTTFLVSYDCHASIGDNTTCIAHFVTCGIIKKERDVFVFILDADGVSSSWWQNYIKQIGRPQIVQPFFNEQIVEIIKKQINDTIEGYYNFINDDTKSHNINGGSTENQQSGYTVLVSFFFIHILYNNIVIHNRNIFENIENISEIIQYIKDLMLFIKTLINTHPFTTTQFFYNYCINIFRFMLSLQNIESFYEVHDVNLTKDIVNAEFANNLNRKHLFLPIQSGSLISLYMKLILQGQQCLPSLIGIPKLSNKSNYKELLKTKDYSCIKFYTPSIKNSIFTSLRLFFETDTEQVDFRNNSVFIMDTNTDKRQYKTEDYLNQIMMIMDPSVVVVNIAKVIDILSIPGRYNTMIKDSRLLNSLYVQNSTTICFNTNDSSTTKSNEQNRQEKIKCDEITISKKQSKILLEKNQYMITLSEYFKTHMHDPNNHFCRNVIEFINSKFLIKDMKISTLYRAFHIKEEYLSQLKDIEQNRYYFNAYYINKYCEKDLKDYGPGFYTLESVHETVAESLPYRIALRYIHENCKCAWLKPIFDSLLMLEEFKKTFNFRLMNILNIDEDTFDTLLYRSENFLVLFYTYFRSIGVKFVQYQSKVYKTRVFVYIDEDYKQNPFTIIISTEEQSNVIKRKSDSNSTSSIKEKSNIMFQNMKNSIFKKKSNLLFEKNEYMITLSNYFKAHMNDLNDDFCRDVIQFINSKFTIKDNLKIFTLYRAFKDQDEYSSQLNEIQKNKYHFNAYYINKQGEKDLKDYGPGFYTLESISDKAAELLPYRITLRYIHNNCKCAILQSRFHSLSMLLEFQRTFRSRIMNILKMDEQTYDNVLYRAENFLVLFYTYFRSIGVKFVLYRSEVYKTRIHVYIDEDYKDTPFTVLDTTHAY